MTERAMPLKLEVGRTYRSREGEIVTIMGMRAHPHSRYRGSDNCHYREDGGFPVGNSPHPFDLVEEVHSVALSCIMTAVEAAHD